MTPTNISRSKTFFQAFYNPSVKQLWIIWAVILILSLAKFKDLESFHSESIKDIYKAVNEGFSATTDIDGAAVEIMSIFPGYNSRNVFQSTPGVTSGFINLNYPEPKIISRIRFDALDGALDRMPAEFIIEGSDDGRSWKTLGEYTSSANDKTDELYYKLENPEPFLHYRIHILRSHGSEVLAFSRLHLEEFIDLRKFGRNALVLVFVLIGLTFFISAKKAAGNLASVSLISQLVVFTSPFVLIALIGASLYVGNSSEFVIDPTKAFAGLLVCLLAATAIMFLLTIFVRRKSPTSVSLLPVFLFATFLIWIEGNLFYLGSGKFDGSEMEWLRSWPLITLDFIACLAILYFVATSRRTLSSYSAAISLIIVAAQLSDVISHHAANKSISTAKYYEPNFKRIATFSKDKNVIFIMIDMLQGDVFNEILEQNPKISTSGGNLKNSLFDFTYYRNVLAAFPTTMVSVPNMLTSTLYRNDISHFDYLKDTFLKTSLFRYLSDKDFHVSPYRFIPNEMYISPEIVKDAITPPFWSSSTYQDIKEILTISVFKSLPYFAKSVFFGSGGVLFSGKVSGHEVSNSRFHLPSTTKRRDYELLNAIQEFANVSETSPNTFKFYHLAGAHPPIDTDENGVALPPSAPRDRADYLRQSIGALKIALNILDVLKKLKVYDDALIIISSDHGWMFPVEGPRREKEKLSGWMSRALPILLLKPPKQKSSAFHITDAPVQLGDIPNTVSHILFNEKPFPNGRPLTEIQENEQRTRYFYLLEGGRPGFGYLPTAREYEVQGHAWNFSSYHLTGRIFAPARTLNEK